MFATFVEQLTRAAVLTDDLVSLCQTWQKTRRADPLHPRAANEAYTLLRDLYTALGTDILGNEDMAPVLDKLYDSADDRAAALQEFDAIDRKLTALLMDQWTMLFGESQMLSQGRQTMADLVVLTVALVRRLSREITPQDSDAECTQTLSFTCVRRWSLVASEEQLEVPIEELSVTGIMGALYAVYTATVRAPYSIEMEEYTSVLFARAFRLLTEPGDEHVWNNDDYRRPIPNSTEFRYSWLFLRDLTILWHALSNHFDLAWLLPREDNPRSECQPSADDIGKARDWLRRLCSPEMDVWVRDNLIRLSMYAGELDFYAADKRSTHARAELVLEDHRPSDYYLLTETAPVPSKIIVHQTLCSDEQFARDGPYAQRESLHLSLIVLSTVRTQIRMCDHGLNPDDFVLFPFGWRERATYIKMHPDQPYLVLLYNHVQVCYRGRLLMYNSALESIAAWMMLLDRRLECRLENYSVRRMVDEFFRHGERFEERQVRLAAEAGEPMEVGSALGVF